VAAATDEVGVFLARHAVVDPEIGCGGGHRLAEPDRFLLVGTAALTDVLLVLRLDRL
jgi:hypothetical protein